jgi:PIN domain nuclease of toxin-antitoxin system
LGSVTVILLDTHVLVWAVAESKRLSKAASAAIVRAMTEGGLAIADITLWELATLLSRGRIQAYGTVEASVRLFTDGIIVKPITPEIAAISAQFPAGFAQDPADRLIAATAKSEGLALITKNEKLRISPLLQTIW